MLKLQGYCAEYPSSQSGRRNPERAETSPSWSAPVTYTIGSSLKADAYATGRFLAVRIKSTGSFAWRLKSIEMDYVKRGSY